MQTNSTGKTQIVKIVKTHSIEVSEELGTLQKEMFKFFKSFVLSITHCYYKRHFGKRMQMEGWVRNLKNLLKEWAISYSKCSNSSLEKSQTIIQKHNFFQKRVAGNLVPRAIFKNIFAFLL